MPLFYRQFRLHRDVAERLRVLEGGRYETAGDAEREDGASGDATSRVPVQKGH